AGPFEAQRRSVAGTRKFARPSNENGVTALSPDHHDVIVIGLRDEILAGGKRCSAGRESKRHGDAKTLEIGGGRGKCRCRDSNGGSRKECSKFLFHGCPFRM